MAVAQGRLKICRYQFFFVITSFDSTVRPNTFITYFYSQQEALKDFTTGPLVTSQTQTSPRFSRLHFRLFQVHPKFLGYSTHVRRSVTMRQYFNFSVTLLRYGLKILTDSWIEGDSLGYPDHPPRRYHPGRQSTFKHFFTNTLNCLHGRLQGQSLTPVTLLHAQWSYS